MEGLLLAELVARNALRYLIGDTVSVHIDLVDARLRAARRARWSPAAPRP